jgi:Uri superfamily endonuclease
VQGGYVLLISLPRAQAVTVGRLGRLDLAAGGYAYVGSALGGLEARIRRHLRAAKKKHWHIDYLLERAPVSRIIMAESGQRLECRLADRLGGRFETVPGFGSSDCKCPGHLFFAPSPKELAAAVRQAFGGLGLEWVEPAVDLWEGRLSAIMG